MLASTFRTLIARWGFRILIVLDICLLLFIIHQLRLPVIVFKQYCRLTIMSSHNCHDIIISVMALSNGFDPELFFAALADRTRLRLLNLLREGEVCTCFFADTLQTNDPKISRHLAY